MRNRWQLSLLTLAGLAAAISIAAHIFASPPPAVAHAGPGVDRWAIDNPHQPDTRIKWSGHAHDTSEWTEARTEHEVNWEGSPGPSPCENPTHHGLRADKTRAHCAYVVKHYNPWLIDKEMHPRHEDVISSWCAVIARGAPGNRTVFEPADTILFVNSTGQATCIDGDDHHSGGPGAEAGTQPTHRYHGDDDFIDQHGDTINAGLPTNQRVIANAHVNGRCCDEVVAQGRHRNDGSINYGSQNSLNLIGRHDHKTVMFWVWWERAADTEPLCDDGTQPPCAEPVTSFAPVVSIGVGAAADGSTFGGTEFGVSFRPLRVGCSAAVSGVYVLEFDVTAQAYVTHPPSPDVSLARSTADGQPCRYRVEFPAAVTTGAFRLTLDRVVGSPVSAADPGVSAAYSVRALTFQPDVTISVPTGTPNSARFEVWFRSAGDAAGCSSPVSARFRAGRNRLAAGSARPWLRAFDTDGGVCSYRASFPVSVSAGGVRLVRTSQSSGLVSMRSPAASASYAVTGNTFFTPLVKITVRSDTPQAYAGVAFEVDLSPYDGFSRNCSTVRGVLYNPGTNAYDDDSPERSVRLVNRIGDGDDAGERCQYEVDFPRSVTARVGDDDVLLLLDESTVDNITRGSARLASATYSDGTSETCESEHNRSHNLDAFQVTGLTTLPLPASTTAPHPGWVFTWNAVTHKCFYGYLLAAGHEHLDEHGGLYGSALDPNSSTRLQRVRRAGSAGWFPDNDARHRLQNDRTFTTASRDQWTYGGDFLGTVYPYPAVEVADAPTRAQFLAAGCKQTHYPNSSYWEYHYAFTGRAWSQTERKWVPVLEETGRRREVNGTYYGYNCYPYYTVAVTPWVCPPTATHALAVIPDNVSGIIGQGWYANNPDPIYFPQQAARMNAWCAGNYTPVVTLNVPDGYRDDQTNEATVEVTITKQSGDADCPTQTATYTPAATAGQPATADHDPILNAACTYAVSYPATAADGELRLVTPVDDPNTAAREDQVAADDPNTAWDERATEATYARQCAKPGLFWSGVGVSLRFGDAEPEFFRGTWNPVNWSDDAARSTAFGRQPASVSFSWAAVDASFGWNSDASDCERAVKHELLVVELPPDNQRRSVTGAALIDEDDRHLPVDVLARSATLPPGASDRDALVALELRLAA